MAVDPPTPTTYRPSGRERECTARRLRTALDEERLSLDTYSQRLEAVYGARNAAELQMLMADLPRRGGIGMLLERTAAAVSGVIARVQQGWSDVRAPRLALPADAVTVGRSPTATAC